MNNKQFYILFFILLSTFSCEKDRRVQFKYSGNYAIEKVEQVFYNGKSIDSTIITNDYGRMLFLDNDSEFNNLILENYKQITKTPVVFSLGNYIFWGFDNNSNKRITFVVSDEFQDLVTVYTVIKKNRNKLNIQFVSTDSLGINYKEIIYLNKK